jgi:hypothetical protein
MNWIGRENWNILVWEIYVEKKDEENFTYTPLFYSLTTNKFFPDFPYEHTFIAIDFRDLQGIYNNRIIGMTRPRFSLQI